jgi:hypothetical protein
MSKTFMETIYGHLSKEYCVYYYILSIIGFILLIIVILSALVIGITKRKNSRFYMEMFMLCIPYALMYFTNRLLYSMCSRSLGVREGMIEDFSGNEYIIPTDDSPIKNVSGDSQEINRCKFNYDPNTIMNYETREPHYILPNQYYKCDDTWYLSGFPDENISCGGMKYTNDSSGKNNELKSKNGNGVGFRYMDNSPCQEYDVPPFFKENNLKPYIKNGFDCGKDTRPSDCSVSVCNPKSKTLYCNPKSDSIPIIAKDYNNRELTNEEQNYINELNSKYGIKSTPSIPTKSTPSIPTKSIPSIPTKSTSTKTPQQIPQKKLEIQQKKLEIQQDKINNDKKELKQDKKDLKQIKKK